MADKPKDEVSEVERIIGSSGGRLAHRDKLTNELKWEVSWESLDFEIEGDVKFGGKMKKVTGILYEKGKPASTFTAGVAQSPTGSNVLSLAEGVVLVSDLYKTTLKCGEVEYDGNSEMVQAKKGISIDSATFTVGGIEAIQTDSKLMEFATPDMYKKK